MLMAEHRDLMSESLFATAGTRVDIASRQFLDDTVVNSTDVEWQRVIDDTLIEWGSKPEEYADDGVDPPNAEVVSLAIEYANRFRLSGLAAPDSVVMDANGGIVFERRTKSGSEVFHFWDDGSVEYQLFDHCKLIERRQR